MAKSKKARKPEVGDVYVMEIEPGIFGSVRVLQAKQEGRTPIYLAATSSWHGTSRPSLDEPGLKQVLHLTHHAWDQRQTYWVGGRPPKDWELLGTIEPTGEEAAEERITHSSWDIALNQVLRQHRWETDREGVLAEDAREEQALREQAQAEAVAESKRLQKTTLAQFRRRRRFANWKAFASPVALRESRRIFRETIDALIPLDPPKNKRQVLKELQHCVEQINALEAEHQCLATIECDDLTTELHNLFAICGMAEETGRLDEWIDW